jgi:hypothetical protein
MLELAVDAGALRVARAWGKSASPRLLLESWGAVLSLDDWRVQFASLLLTATSPAAAVAIPPRPSMETNSKCMARMAINPLTH